MGAAFRMHQQMGRAKVAARVGELNRRCRAGLAAIRGVRLRTPRDPSLCGGLTCFEVDGLTHDQVVERLLQKRIIGSSSPYAVSYARLSAGLMNTPEDVDRSVAAVATIATPS
jgi:selenocysteine lyase/cysteine desulfurase